MALDFYEPLQHIEPVTAENKLHALSGGLEATDLKYLALQAAWETRRDRKATKFALYFIKHLNKRHRMCVFTVPNPRSGSTPMMMYLSWGAACVMCCQNHSGHTWSQHPSPIFTGTNQTGRSGISSKASTLFVCVNGLVATSPLCHDPAAQTLHYPSLWKWLHAAASSTNSPHQNNQPPFLF